MSEVPEDKPVVITSFEELTNVQSAIIGLNYQIDTANAKRDERIGRAKDIYDFVARVETESAAETTDPLEAERDQLREAIATYLMKGRRRLRHRFGKTIESLFGTVKWRVIAASVETPRDTSEVINHLLNRRGGKRYLRVRYDLDKKALLKAPDSLKRSLRPFGVYIGKQETLTMQLKGESEPTTLRKYRFPRLRHQ
ncbi:MAG TPA: host-nuclease inhibitor Gam family protein [Candidatus Saccharimonadales bacterium]|nr:host-nuclease inhibitor Gam family protein [Candidatus Saccharimonadales bacterium]